MIKQIFLLPIIHYVAIFSVFFIYEIKNFNKGSLKKNFSFGLFCLILLAVAINISPDISSHYLLDSFHSDTVLIKNKDINITVNLDDLFQGEYGIFSKNERIIDEIYNLRKESIFELYFYKKDKVQLKLKLCKASNEDAYSFKINGDSLVLIYNGNMIKFNPIFYDNLDKILRGQIES